MYKKIIVYFLFCLSNFQLYAQMPYIQNMQYPYQLPTKVIYDMNIDRQGILYLGTDKGLFKFDGKSSTQIPFKETRKAEITHLKEDKIGRIWGMNFAKEIFYLYDDTLRNFPLEIEGKEGALVNFEFTENQIWLMTHFTISSYDFKTFKKKFTYTYPKYLSQLGSFKNQIFVATEYKIMIFDEKYKFFSQDTKTGFEVSFQEKNGDFYCIQRREIKDNLERISLQWKNNQFIRLPDIELDKKIFVHHQVVTDNQFWLCTKQGAYTFEPKTGKTMLIFPDKNVTDVVRDYQGNYWLSTLNEGLWFCPSLQNKEFMLPTDWQLNTQLTSLSIFKNDLYIGTAWGKILKTDKKNLNVWKEFGKVSNSEVKRIIIEKEKKLLAASSGLFTIEGKSIITNILLKDAKFYDYEGKKMLLLSTAYGFRLIDIEKRHQLPTLHNIVFDSINTKMLGCPTYSNSFSQRTYSVAVSVEKQKFWVGYDDGLIEYNFAGKMKNINAPQNKKIIAQCMEVDKQERLWVGTFQQGLFLMEDNKIIKHFAIGKNLKNNHIQRIIAQKDKIWISTEAEIGYIDAKTLKFTDVLAQSGLSSSFGFSDFYPDENKIWIVTAKSLIALNINTENKKEELKILPIRLSESNTFKVEVLHYKNPSKVQIIYRLKNTGEDWQIVNETQTTLQYNYLRKGTYILEIFAKDAITQVESVMQVIEFSIEPKWWETWWFFGISFLIIIGFIVLVVYLVIRRNQQKQLLKEQLWISQIKALQNQMNPHFLYNILNTVQGLVYSDKKNEAGELLGNFSDLMRNTLQISEKPYISLEEEINLLQLYVDLEKVRFEQDLECNFIFRIENKYNEYHIPSMLLQPFIENAFKHGLLHKKGKKILTIIFENQNENLLVTIDDNGIGRKYAQEIRTRQARKSTGFAMKATEQRMELLNKISSYHIEMKIIDKYNEQNQSEGTTVLIKLQLKK